MNTESLRSFATDALRYWEPRRFAYNGLLAAIVLWYFAKGWPESLHGIGFDGIVGIFILAVLANVAYCAAYVVDLFLQFSDYREQRGRWRMVILTVGFAFAAALTRFFAMGMFRPMLSFPS